MIFWKKIFKNIPKTKTFKYKKFGEFELLFSKIGRHHARQIKNNICLFMN